MPHILLRLPYGPETNPTEGFEYREDASGTDSSKFLWGNAAYALGVRMTDSFAKYSWCASIRGVQGGGLVEGLPTHTFMTEDGDLAMKCPTEVAIPDRREGELSALGFAPLLHEKGTDRAAFFAVQSCNLPGQYQKDEATANARLAGQLQYTMAVSRFAHYLKIMMRDRIGSFMSRADCERYLQNWISQYVLASPDVGIEQKARMPLSAAKIEVVEDPARPGCYNAVAHLKPHYQLDELTISLRLVAKLPDSARK